MTHENYEFLKELIGKKSKISREEVEQGLSIIAEEIQYIPSAVFPGSSSQELLKALEVIKKREQLVLLSSFYESSKLRHIDNLDTIKKLKKKLKGFDRNIDDRISGLDARQNRSEQSLTLVAKALARVMDRQNKMNIYMDDLAFMHLLQAGLERSEDEETLQSLLSEKLNQSYLFNTARTFSDFESYFGVLTDTYQKVIQELKNGSFPVTAEQEWFQQFESMLKSLEAVSSEATKLIKDFQDKQAIEPTLTQDMFLGAEQLLQELSDKQKAAHALSIDLKQALMTLLGDEYSDLKNWFLEMSLNRAADELHNLSNADKEEDNTQKSSRRARERLGLFKQPSTQSQGVDKPSSSLEPKPVNPKAKLKKE